MAPKDRAEWLLRDFPASTPDERQAKAALVHIVRDAIAAAEAAERERGRIAMLAELDKLIGGGDNRGYEYLIEGLRRLRQKLYEAAP